MGQRTLARTCGGAGDSPRRVGGLESGEEAVAYRA
jgi:hypothetical protein